MLQTCYEASEIQRVAEPPEKRPATLPDSRGSLRKIADLVRSVWDSRPHQGPAARMARDGGLSAQGPPPFAHTQNPEQGRDIVELIFRKSFAVVAHFQSDRAIVQRQAHVNLGGGGT